MKQTSQTDENMSNFSQLSLGSPKFRVWILYYVFK